MLFFLVLSEEDNHNPSISSIPHYVKKIVREQKVWDLLGVLSKLLNCIQNEKLRIKNCYLETLLLPPCIPETFCQECFVRSSLKRLPPLGPHRCLKGVLFAPSQPTSFWTPDGTCPLSSHCHSQTIFLPASLKLMPPTHPPGCCQLLPSGSDPQSLTILPPGHGLPFHFYSDQHRWFHHHLINDSYKFLANLP